MSEQELMRPRYKVIADYPGMNNYLINVGDIITDDGKNQCVTQDEKVVFAINWNAYPHLFKKLEWWEERDGFADFPKYVKLVLNGRIQFMHKVQEWKGYNSHGQPLYDFVNKANYLSPFCVSGLMPATEQQYTDYINSLTK